MLQEAEFAALVKTFASDLQRNFASLTQAQAEDQLKRPVQNLLHGLWPTSVVTRTEAQVEEVRGRPDIAVDVDGLISGYAELKAPGLGSDPGRFRDAHSREQWQRFKQLPNLLYTDGSHWSLYRYGQLEQRVRADGEVTEVGGEAYQEREIRKLYLLLLEFVRWKPSAPTTPRALAELLAPVTRIIREDVQAALQDKDSGISAIADDWRFLLFPTADDAQFADAYAQTLTYSFLLARFHGATDLDPEFAARALDTGHGLLADALRVLANPQVRQEVGIGLELLLRIVKVVDPEALQNEGNDPWLYFYEHFLAEYDPRLRNNLGVYYTPPAVIGAQVRLVDQLLSERLGKDLGLANEDVVVLDPAAGTGAYPLAIIQTALGAVTDRFGPGIRQQFATQLAQNVLAFEILVGPYAVAHLRVTQKLLEEGGSLPETGARVYLTDTLESPYQRDLEKAGFLYRRLAEEHKQARKVKASTRVLVCIGNPPYDRQQLDEEDVERGVERQGGWVRFGDPTEGDRETTGILRSFIEPAVAAGRGADLKNIYNLYVYFWRWALWKVFEAENEAGDSQNGPGVVSFITASSYLRGPGFVGMREHMRRTFDELWIIDLEGDNLGARRTENVFNIQSPVAIAIGVRYGQPNADKAATVWYTRVEGTRSEKFQKLDAIRRFDDVTWRQCSSDWHSPFLPIGSGDYYSWPKLTDLFPWQLSGAQFKRTWPIGETRAVLEERWIRLVAASPQARPSLFRETRDRKVDRTYVDPLRPGRLPAITSLPANEPVPPIVQYAYRSFDRQWAILDGRLGDFLRPTLWQTHSDTQVYMTSFLTAVLGRGPAATVAAYPPDLDHFRGSFGGRHIIPLWRDAAAQTPNVATGLLDTLGEQLNVSVTPEDLFAYAYALLSTTSYVETYSEELTIPGPRLPITADPKLFVEAAAIGCRLIGWHTYGKRMGLDAPRGMARNTTPVPTTPDGYPNEFRYDEKTCKLHVGEGVFAPIPPEVIAFEVSGLQVVSSWLSHRMREPSGRNVSSLDRIRPASWTAGMTVELLELLWTLEATVSHRVALDDLLQRIISGPLVATSSLPTPSAADRQPVIEDGSQGTLF